MNDERFIWRFRLLAVCAVLTAITFIQQPGRIVGDTKLDLVVNPGGFLSRALSMWDPDGAFGQLQNQAYGYLFPMGPFFLVGKLASIDPWVVQRLWWTTILCVAFLGMVKLSGLLGVQSGWVRILAGVAFALSPRMLSVLGPSSIEVWPAAMAPWVLIPLVLGVQRGEPKRWAAVSALAVAAVGGVNAAATSAVLPLGILYLLTAPRGPRRKAMVIWWPPLVVLGTLWWLIPLALLGRYSPPFLDYIETASVTSLATDLFDVLRGTVNWVAYIDPTSVAGNDLVATPILILNGTIIVALGIVGLSRADMPHRRFLVSSAVVGIVLVAISHGGPESGVLMQPARDLLDGVLAPLRNTHKFELIVRIPMVLGMAYLLDILMRSSRDSPTNDRPDHVAGGRSLLAVGMAALATIAVVGASAPAWSAQLANRGSFTEIPGYWHDAADWLGDHDAGTSLLIPASGFGDYAWGRAGDEPMQALAQSPWAVRNLIPLAPGGNIEMLDAVSTTLATGQGGPGFAANLRRSGVAYLVVRNDLDKSKDLVDTELVYATIRSTPGLTSVTSFGPQVGGEPYLPTTSGRSAIVNDGWQSGHPAIEIFSVSDVPEATSQNVDETPVLVGDAKSLMELDRLDITRGSQTILAPNAPKTAPPSYLLTDGTRRQEAGFGTVNHNRSSSLARNDPYSISRPVHQYDASAISRWQTVPRLEGATRVRASSAQSSVDVLPFTRIDEHAWAAFDNDPDTAWHASSSDVGRSSWVEIDFDHPTDLGQVEVTMGLPESVQRQISVTTETGTKRTIAQGGVPARFEVGTVSRLRISGVSSLDFPFAVSDVSWVGKSVSRPLVMPTVPGTWGAPDRILMSVGEGYTSGCLTIDDQLRCGQKKAGSGEDGRLLDRVFTTTEPSNNTTRLRVTGRGTAALDDLAQQGKLVSIASSSRVVDSPQASPIAAIDGKSSTGWVASTQDPSPSLTVRWVGKRKISRIAVSTAKGLPATPPKSATLTFANGTKQTVRFTGGAAEFSPVKTDSVAVTLQPGRPQFNLDYSGAASALPVGVSELSFPQVDVLPLELATEPISYPCGTGPTVSADGTNYKSRLKAAPRELIDGADLEAEVCGNPLIRLESGEHRVTVQGTDALRPTALLLSREGAARLGTWNQAQVDGSSVNFGETDQSVVVGMTHNANRGWVATADGRSLSPVILNGWQQGWIVKAGSGTSIETRFAPERVYKAGLATGLLGALALLILVVSPWGRQQVVAGRPRAGSGRVLSAVLLAALTLAVSPWCVLGAICGGIASHLMVRLDRGDPAWLAGAPILATGLWAALRPWGGSDTWFGDAALPQFLVALSLGIMVSRLATAPRFRQR